jgi:hypothetical protein
MKKIASLLLGLSLVVGTASLAFSQDAPKPTKKNMKKKKSKKKKESKKS